jgi:hypothetical protein
MTIERIILILIVAFIVCGCSAKQKIINNNGNSVTVECQPVYGNWCGKGYPAYEVTGYMPEPVDVWDNVCKEHDLCYDNNAGGSKSYCDTALANSLERFDQRGIPAPHQIINAYNYFKENKPFRQFNVSFRDLWNASTISCKGGEGLPTIFCDVGRGRDNCEISMGHQGEGAPCFCDYPNIITRFGVVPGGRFFGHQKTANSF